MSFTVLSLQSHVAFGHVGNAAAVFPLQRLGVEVWPVHTCQLSNHTGYPGFEGTIFAADHLRDVLRGMEARGALEGLSGVLSGWLGRPEIGEAVLWALERAGPDALYLCDPVMGDHLPDGSEELYAAPGIPEFFRDHLVPRAAVVTPNRFELGLLTGRPVDSLDDALVAARQVLSWGCGRVVVTSLPGPGGSICSMAVDPAGAWLVETPRLTFPFALTGTGDALAALLMGRLLQGADLEEALAYAVSGLHAVLRRTQEMGMRELQLVAAQDVMVAPEPVYAAREV